ncbi:MAG: methyl-accepting chemotaxis protein [Opitutus sp.]
MNVNQKIWLSFGTVLALVGVGSTLSYRKSSEADRSITRLAKEYLAEYKAAKSAAEDISMARVHEQAFASHKNEAEVALVKAELDKVRADMKELQAATPDTARTQAAGTVVDLIDSYGKTFERAHQLLVRRGLNPELGLEGEMRKAVHEVEAKVKDQGLAELDVLLLMVRRHEKDYLLRGDPGYLDQINTRIGEFAVQMKQFSLAADLQKDIAARWGAYAGAMKALVDGDRELNAAYEKLLLTGKAAEDAVVTLADSCSKDIDTAQAATLNDLNVGRRAVLLIGIGSGIIGAAMAVWVAFSLASLNRNIRHGAEAVDQGSREILNASTQLTRSSQTLASGSSEQAASLEETSASLEELSAMTKRNADNAVRARELATQTRAAADGGSARMEQMKQAMDEIKASSHDISKIIKTIDEIAFQTNILALNAAVEAARAGEAGMGFAVVAEEVRNLAQRAAQSARETAGKIETSVAKSEHGVTISADVAQSLAEIVAKAREVDALVAEIAQASSEQSQGIVQVNTAVSEMDRVTQANAATAEESASAAEELDAQTKVLQQAATELLAIVGGRVKRDEPEPAHAPIVTSAPSTPSRHLAEVPTSLPLDSIGRHRTGRRGIF